MYFGRYCMVQLLLKGAAIESVRRYICFPFGGAKMDPMSTHTLKK
jgi:hypothetical protein